MKTDSPRYGIAPGEPDAWHAGAVMNITDQVR